MVKLTRQEENPILTPNINNLWEFEGAFNGCVVKVDGTYHMVYRAISGEQVHNGVKMQLSTIGYAQSADGIHFGEHRQLIAPTEDWEMYGCEDPRITYMDGKFYIFYTALSVYPFAAYGIKLAVAITSDFKTFEKHPVTTFNSKAMGMFPEKINGKMAALLTINTDLPPAKIALALFDREEDIWSQHFWNEWYENANGYIIPLMRDMRDQVELGAPPIKTERGWLVIYSYIKNYMSNDKDFGIEAVLLDLDNPTKVIGRTPSTLLSPEKEYELNGLVANVIFPSGALINDDKLFVYYGAADTRCALATCDLGRLLEEISPKEFGDPSDVRSRRFTRYEGNPILKPALELEWQSAGVFNPAAIYLDGKVHIVYRAQGKKGESVMGYASSRDGLTIDENLEEPIYVPRESFEKKEDGTGNSGCEDPRITEIDGRLYMAYTAFDGANPPRVALTSISKQDFLDKKWDWETPRLVSPPGVDDKDACVVKNTHGEGYLAFHRLGSSIWLDVLRTLDSTEERYWDGNIIAETRDDKWDNVKLGIGSPPIETEHGWLLTYHAVSDPGFKYMMGAMLLDYNDPHKILGRTNEPLLIPEEKYEIEGQVPNVVFGCGTVVIDGVIYMYYGGGDSVVGVATMNLDDLLKLLLKN